jgi:hypothetical protein
VNRCFHRDNRRKARKSPFESIERFTVSIRDKFATELSEEIIQSRDYLFIYWNHQQIFRPGRSNDVLRCIIEHLIPAISMFGTDLSISVQIIYDVLK